MQEQAVPCLSTHPLRCGGQSRGDGDLGVMLGQETLPPAESLSRSCAVPECSSLQQWYSNPTVFPFQRSKPFRGHHREVWELCAIACRASENSACCNVALSVAITVSVASSFPR